MEDFIFVNGKKKKVHKKNAPTRKNAYDSEMLFGRAKSDGQCLENSVQINPLPQRHGYNCELGF